MFLIFSLVFVMYVLWGLGWIVLKLDRAYAARQLNKRKGRRHG